MPPQLLFDIAGLDLAKMAFGPDDIRQFNPQRGDMEMLDGINFVDESLQRLVGFKDVRLDEFWTTVHIPGRPLFPGVLMIEAAAQLASYYTRKYVGWTGFVGFGGVETCRFRQQIVPPARLYLLGQQRWNRHGRIGCDIQGIVDGNIVFETGIIGVRM